jgi:Asp-tRNA(Asn)/Glu-tRNA(Gln) amidotransferase A subunit family amidase
VNALVSLRDGDVLLQEADAADQVLAKGESRGWMHGFPHAVKDLASTRGIRTTQGSPLFRDVVPDVDAVVVERIRRAGAIVIGKTNVSEFGLGSHTYNQVFGATRNPYALDRTAGGSSGGAAVALALHMVPHWPREVAGVAMDTYHRWMEVMVPATMASLPAISVPAGFNADGLPMGMQMIGRPRPDLAVLQLAYAYEQATQWVQRRPPPFGR